MLRLFRLAVLLAVSGVAGLAQPVVAAIENNYSYVLPGLPNYGIAQGSIFVIFGSNLAPVSTGLQTAPLTTAIDGVSVQFSVQGTITQALLYYVTPNQIAGILPSSTPIGNGNYWVISGGGRSQLAPVTVVQSAPAIAVGGDGAAGFDSNGNALSAFNSANAGDTIVFYGTGAGPVSGDESVEQTPQNLDSVPIEVDIGGIPATVNYHGRSTYPGLDQFNVVVPAGVWPGCNVSVVARSGIFTGNIAYIPVALGSRVCSDPGPGVQFDPVEYLSGKTTYVTANFSLSRFTTSTLPNYNSLGAPVPASFNDIVAGGGYIQQTTVPPGGSVQVGNIAYVFPSLGSCAIYTLPADRSALDNSSAQVARRETASATTSTLLNAGPALNFTGPNGEASASLGKYQSGQYATGSLAANFIPSGGGNFTIDDGSGGSDIGPFSIQIDYPPPLIWTNMNGITSVDRSQGVTFTWTGGNPNGFLYLGGGSFAANGTQVTFQCYDPVAAQQFTIPPSVLLALPALPAPSGGVPTKVSSFYIEADETFLSSPSGMDAAAILTGTLATLQTPVQ